MLNRRDVVNGFVGAGLGCFVSSQLRAREVNEGTSLLDMFTTVYCEPGAKFYNTKVLIDNEIEKIEVPLFDIDGRDLNNEAVRLIGAAAVDRNMVYFNVKDDEYEDIYLYIEDMAKAPITNFIHMHGAKIPLNNNIVQTNLGNKSEGFYKHLVDCKFGFRDGYSNFGVFVCGKSKYLIQVRDPSNSNRIGLAVLRNQAVTMIAFKDEL